MPSDEAPSRRRLLRAAGATLSTALAGCSGTGVRSPESGDDSLRCSTTDQLFPNDWPLYGYDSHNTGWNPNATGPEDGVEVRWTDGDRQVLWGVPVVAGDTVYVQESSTRLTAYARQSGSKRWTREIETAGDSTNTNSYSGVHLTPAVVGDTAYVGGGYFEVEEDGTGLNRVANRVHLYAVDRHAGDVLWTVQPDEFVATPPVVVGDLVLFATLAGEVYAVDATRESVAWTVSLEPFDPPVTPLAVDGCRLYVATPTNGLYALDVTRGELNWHLPAVASRAAPVVVDGTVYVGGTKGVLYAVDTETESVEWQRDLGRAVSTASPAVASGTVFVGDADGDPGDARPRVHALDAETGDRLWAAETRNYVNSSPAVADGVAYVAAQDRVYGFDAERGDELWTHETHGSIRGPLSVADGTLYAATTFGQVYALVEAT